MKSHSVRLAAATVMAVVMGLLTCLVAPAAYACACGAMEPSNQRSLGVDGETAAILFDGRTQTTVMGMSLETDADSVAFLMPVPRRAEVSVADPELFDQLVDLTRPVVERRYEIRPRFLRGDSAPGTAGGGRPQAQVVGRQRVGDYDVAQLTGSAGAVAAWLTDNGYRVRPEVTAGFSEYLDQGWVVLAAKLVFDSERFSGTMRPLVLRFATDRIVHPMKLSALAAGSQPVRFYVVTDRRVDVRVGSRTLTTSYAGRVDAAALTAGGAPAAADLLGDGPVWLTRVDGVLDPPAITTDLVVGPAAAGDTEYRSTRTVTVDISGPVSVGAVALGVVLGGVLALVIVRRRRPRG